MYFYYKEKERLKADIETRFAIISKLIQFNDTEVKNGEFLYLRES